MTMRPGMSDDMPTDRPSVARMYDYLLGGYHNFASDRTAADAATALYPDFPRVMQANRAFLRRGVAFLVAQGIDQFLDLGSGIPTAGNVHEVVQDLNPAARVVYVDRDPVAVIQSKTLLRDNPAVTVIQADVGQPEAVLGHPDVTRLLDLHKPLAVLLVALLHFVTDDTEAHRLTRALRDVMAPGSYLVVSHATEDGVAPETVRQLTDLYTRSSTATKGRSADEIATFFTGLDMVEPGLVYTPLWRPEGPDDLFLDHPERAIAYAGVGRKP
jgi:hypothetical protein